MHLKPPEDGPIFILVLSSIAVLVCIAIFIVSILTGCQYLPQVAKDVEDIATDTAVKVEVSREALNKDTNLDIAISVKNKEVSK